MVYNYRMMLEILISTFAGTVVYLILGWILFQKLSGAHTDANTTHMPGFKKSAAEVSMTMLVVSCIAYTLLISILFSEWTHTNTFAEGARIGAVMGGLIALMSNSYWYATSHFFNNLKPIVAHVSAAVVAVALTGGVIGFVQGLF